MARPLRIEFAGAVYHITSRGNGRQKIFLDEQDNRKFLDFLEKTLDRFNWICHAFCLMINHYHLMIETPDANLSRGMHYLNGAFCQSHNKRHDTAGHLFQGRFKAILVDRESYLLELARYVVLNPVRAGLADRPEDWPWSSFRATAGLPVPEKAGFLTTDWLLGQFGPDKEAARQRYCDFVRSGIGLDSPWRNLQSQLLLANDGFIDRLRGAMPEKAAVKAIPKRQRYATRPHLKDIFAELDTKGKRNEAMVASHLTYGYDQKEIADFLGIHYTTVSRAIKRHRKTLNFET